MWDIVIRVKDMDKYIEWDSIVRLEYMSADRNMMLRVRGHVAGRNLEVADPQPISVAMYVACY